MPNPTFGVANVIIPQGGPKCIPYNLNFNGVSQATIDPSQALNMGMIEFIQTLFIDNFDNPNELTVTIQPTGQRLKIGAGKQGYFSVLAPNNPTFAFATTAGAFFVNVQLINVPIQPAVW
jgi:hypothetical protein